MSTEKKQQEFNEFRETINSLREKIQDTGERFIANNFKEIFEKYPYLEEVSWTGYTPYFNYGDECTYRSRHRDPEIYGQNCGYGTKNQAEVKASIKEFMDLFDNDLMLDLFGDHARITVTKEGLTVEEYEHD